MFHAGMPEWKKAKGFLVSEPDYVMEMIRNEGSFVLVDLRPSDKAARGHIAGAVTIPVDNLKTSADMFPADKTAPVILYSQGTADEDAYLTVAEWGYKNVSVMNGGIQGWQRAKGELIAGNLETKIVFVKKIPKNQIGIEEFSSVVEKGSKDKVILDVRDADTVAKGNLKGAITIPLAELESRLSELPKDKEIIIHCNTGIMAGMAQKTLQEKGYNSRSLNAVIQIASDGSYEITEK